MTRAPASFPASPLPDRALWPLLGLGALLRLHGLGVHSFWYDEAASLAVATAADPLAALRGDRHPPLSFLLLRLWTALVGTDDAWLRLLPALAGIAALGGFAVVARRLLPQPAARLAVALFAVAPCQVWYAQELRMYAWLELGTVLALLGAVPPVGGLWRRGLWSFAGSAVALGSHYFGFLVPALVLPFAVGGRWLGAAPVRRAEAAATLGGAAAGALAWAPWLLLVVPEQLRTPWGFQARLGVRDLVELPVRLVVVMGSALPAWLPAACGLAVGLALLAAVLAAVRGAGWARQPLLGLLLAAAALAAAFLLAPPNLQPFYVLGTAPLLYLALGGGLHGLARAGRWPGLAWLLPIGLLAATCLLRRGNLKEDYRGAVAELAASWRPGDLVVAVTGTPEFLSQAGLRHYLRGRPDLLAAIRDLPGLQAQLDRGERPADRLQVLFRNRPYAEPSRRALQAAAAAAQAGPERVLLQHLVLELRR